MILKYENYGPTENSGLDILYLELLCEQETAHCRLHFVYKSPSTSFTLLTQANITDYVTWKPFDLWHCLS